METEVLRWFQLVADGVTVTEVAQMHLVSQPAVSRALDRLDTQVGTPLLVRAGRVLKPTAAGAVFKAHLDRSLHHLDDGLAAIGELLDPATGQVTLAFETVLGAWMVPGVIAGFKREFPRIRFRLIQTHEAHGWESLLVGRVDMVFTSQIPPAESLQREALTRLPLALAVPPNHRLAQRDEVSLSEAVAEPFVMVQGDWQLRNTTAQLCADAGFTPTVEFEGEDISVVRGFVAAGLGVAVVPVTHGESRHRRTTEKLVRLADTGAFLDVGLVWSAERRLLPSAQLFRDYALSARGRPKSASQAAQSS